MKQFNMGNCFLKTNIPSKEKSESFLELFCSYDYYHPVTPKTSLKCHALKGLAKCTDARFMFLWIP